MYNKLASVLHMEWINEGKYITGYWAEDYNAYRIDAPEQLIPVIVLMQNWLSKKYNQIHDLERDVQNLRRWFK